jgi:hypothetical protein
MGDVLVGWGMAAGCRVAASLAEQKWQDSLKYFLKMVIVIDIKAGTDHGHASKKC